MARAGPKTKPIPPSRWKKGQSGNPSGYPKALVEVSKAAKEYTPESMKFLGKVLRDEKESTAARLKAVEILLDRGWGRPAQTLNVRRILDYSDLTDEELLALARGAEIQAAALGCGPIIENADEPESDENG